MADKLFTQKEANRMIAIRLKWERGRVSRDFENSLKRCIASTHLTLHREMCMMK